MYKNRGNTGQTYKSRRRPQRQSVTPAQQARFIADSIRARLLEGRGYSLADYGIDRNPEMIRLVSEAMHKWSSCD